MISVYNIKFKNNNNWTKKKNENNKIKKFFLSNNCILYFYQFKYLWLVIINKIILYILYNRYSNNWITENVVCTMFNFDCTVFLFKIIL